MKLKGRRWGNAGGGTNGDAGGGTNRKGASPRLRTWGGTKGAPAGGTNGGGARSPAFRHRVRTL